MSKRVWTQTELKQYLESNPLNVKVEFGIITDLNNQDYIFVDLLREQAVGFDNNGLYLSTIQFVIATKDFDNRKTLVKYIKDMFTCSFSYDKADESEYYAAYCTTTLIMEEE